MTHAGFGPDLVEVFGPSQQDGGPELVQLLTPEGERVEHPEFSFGDGMPPTRRPSHPRLLPRHGAHPPHRHRGHRAPAPRRARHLGPAARPGGRADRRRPRAAPAGLRLPDLPRARRRLLPRRRPAQPARPLPRRRPGRLGPQRQQLRPLHDRDRRPDPARHRLRHGHAARRRRRHRRPRARRRGDRPLRRRRLAARATSTRRSSSPRPTTPRSCSSARTTSGRSPSRSSGRRRIPLYQRALGFGFPGVRVDGNDVLATYAVTQAALQRARDGQGPTFVEAYTYRMGAHTTTDDPTRYRLSDDVEHWKLKDPIARVEVYLKRNGLADDDFFDGRPGRGRRPRPPPARGLQGAARPAAAEHVRPRLRRDDRGAAPPSATASRRTSRSFEGSHADERTEDHARQGPQHGPAQGDGGRPQGPAHGRGRRQARRRLPDHRRPAEGLRRGPRHRQPARRVRHRRHRGRHGAARLPARRRDPVRRLRLPGVRPDRLPGREDALPQPGQVQDADGHPDPVRRRHRRGRAPQRSRRRRSSRTRRA